MSLFVSIVSHGHAPLIRKLNSVACLSTLGKVVIKSNLPGEDFGFLSELEDVYIVSDRYYLGFGENNNSNFAFCRDRLGMKDEDIFLVINPDVYIESQQLARLEAAMREQQAKIATINLYKDAALSVYDCSVRKFPTFLTFVKSYCGMGNDSILDKSKIGSVTQVDWAAGSFLAFLASHFERLAGFDKIYFMYCEDVDICYRSHIAGHGVFYFPEISAVHFAQHANRTFFSKHFFWHFSSVIRFLLKSRFLSR